MGVIVKYLLDFKGAGFKVSNDLLEGFPNVANTLVIDVSVEAKMDRGAAGSTFEIKLYNLPEKKAGTLYDRAKTPPGGNVAIKLGYMDGKFDTVMEGIYTDVSTHVEGDDLITTVKGDESGTYALKHTRFQKNIPGNVKFQDAITKLLKDAPFEKIASTDSGSGIGGALGSLLGNGAGDGSLIDKTPKVENVPVETEDSSMKGENLMEVLDRLTTNADAELLVSDKKIYIGRPITNDTRKPFLFDQDINLATFRKIAKNLPGEDGDNRLIKLEPKEVLGFRFVATGDPQLRPGQKVFANIENFQQKDADFRIHSLVHRLTMSGGYICEGKAVKTCSPGDEDCRRQQDAIGLGNANRVAQKLSQQTKDMMRRNPVVEVGSVKQYNPGEASTAPHRTTLYFGQRFPKIESQPSIRAEVEKEEDQLYLNKPIASPFAWHKCGLVVPVYPDMKALLGHNLGLSDDGIVTGFLWSQKPNLEPPKSKEGDWWLCLPIDFDSSSPPTDSTKAANDLITNEGNRVIEVKGLKITIGKDTLPSVGTRPTPGEDDEFLIEHKSGTKFQISSDGSLSIEASKVSIKGDVTIEGNVEIK